MSMKFLSPEASMRLLKLSIANEPLPAEISSLRDEIEGRTRAAELRASVSGVDLDQVREIVGLKLELDRRIGLWAEGKPE